MTDQGSVKAANASTNPIGEQQLNESDIEQEDSINTDDKSNVTTDDDEFYNELMAAPPEHEDHLSECEENLTCQMNEEIRSFKVPDECKDELAAVEHLTTCLNRRYNSSPVVFMGTLKEAVRAAFNSKDIKERRPLAIYINNDKSVYSNLFCSQLLCNDVIIDFLLNNYVLWAWDITFDSNARMFTELCKVAFTPWIAERQFSSYAVDRYPLLLVVRRDTQGDYVFHRIIEGPTKKPTTNELISRLMELKDLFDQSERDLQAAREESKRQILFDPFWNSDIGRRTNHYNDFMRSTSVHGSGGRPIYATGGEPQFGRLLSNDSGLLRHHHRQFPTSGIGEISGLDSIHHPFGRLNVDRRQSDEDVDEDDEEATPTVERASAVLSPRFPQ